MATRAIKANYVYAYRQVLFTIYGQHRSHICSIKLTFRLSVCARSAPRTTNTKRYYLLYIALACVRACTSRLLRSERRRPSLSMARQASATHCSRGSLVYVICLTMPLGAAAVFDSTTAKSAGTETSLRSPAKRQITPSIFM